MTYLSALSELPGLITKRQRLNNEAIDLCVAKMSFCHHRMFTVARGGLEHEPSPVYTQDERLSLLIDAYTIVREAELLRRLLNDSNSLVIKGEFAGASRGQRVPLHVPGDFNALRRFIDHLPEQMHNLANSDAHNPESGLLSFCRWRSDHLVEGKLSEADVVLVSLGSIHTQLDYTAGKEFEGELRFPCDNFMLWAGHAHTNLTTLCQKACRVRDWLSGQISNSLPTVLAEAQLALSTTDFAEQSKPVARFETLVLNAKF